jgi:hypothetical protein
MSRDGGSVDFAVGGLNRIGISKERRPADEIGIPFVIGIVARRSRRPEDSIVVFDLSNNAMKFAP